MATKIEVYDTTLRDGTQGLGVNLSLLDKVALTQELDQLGVDFIEGGWPGSNPKDQGYFEQATALDLKHAKIVAFGSTRRHNLAAEQDPNLAAIVQSQAHVSCIFGKTWELHVKDALRVGLDDNLKMISDSIGYLAQATGRPVFFDAEHFFDGFRANPSYALDALAAALEGGASRLVLCDTNGGSLPSQVVEAIASVRERLPQAALGIHVHNDGGLAVANTLAALQAGCVQVQGTINGVGERCGNVDLTTVIANCELKLGLRCLPEGHLERLTAISRTVWERMNTVGPLNQPYVGDAAFAHKGGIHVSAVQRNEQTYEHVRPEQVGNVRRILISEMSGRSNVRAKLANRYPELKDDALLARVLEQIQDRENLGYSYEAADGSFDLLVRREIGTFKPAFDLDYYRVHGIGTNGKGSDLVEATVKLRVKGEQRLCAAEGHGPVDALSHALMQALLPAFPLLLKLNLTDFKVRVVNSSDGTAAKVRVLIEHHIDDVQGLKLGGGLRFGTVGVSDNVIEASWQALAEAVEYVVSMLPVDATAS